MLYYEVLKVGFYRLLPNKASIAVRKVINDIVYSTKRYFKGQSLVATCVGILFSIGFLIIGLPLAIPLGIFIGFLNMIPYAQCIGFPPAAILCFLHSYESGRPFLTEFIFTCCVFICVQVIEDTLLTPKIMGKVTGLNPAIILLCLSIGGTLFGIPGIIMALPLAPMILIYYRTYILKDPADLKLEKGEDDFHIFHFHKHKHDKNDKDGNSIDENKKSNDDNKKDNIDGKDDSGDKK